MDSLDLLKRNRQSRQKGELIETPTAFFVRYYIPEVYDNGRRKTKCEKLADRSDIYRSRQDVQLLMDAVMERVTTGNGKRATGQWTLTEFVSRVYLPWATTNKAAPTVNGYEKLWDCYLAPHVGSIALANLRTSQVTKVLDHFAVKGLGRHTLSHIKFVLSGIYEYAITTGVLPMGANPVRSAVKGQGAKWTVRVARPEKQKEYSLEQVKAILKVLEPVNLQAAAAVALCYFGSLRPAEARGLKWDDYDGEKLYIRRTVWRGLVGETKNETSARAVTVIEPLRSLLERLKAGHLAGEYILSNSNRKPVSLDALNGRVIAPALEKAAISYWVGYYACRRGFSSLMTEVSKNVLNASGHLGHANPATTLSHYTKAQQSSIDATLQTIETMATREKTEVIQ
jgi:integrase